jgi:Spy/CpxP family protein refolding chaperone
MKKTFLTALIICASVCTAFAQDQKATTASDATVTKETDQKTMDAKKAQEWQNLVTELKLTDEQVTKIAEMNKAFGERRKAIENNADLTDEAKAERKAALKKAQEAQFTRLLTPEQQAKYKELMEAKNK